MVKNYIPLRTTAQKLRELQEELRKIGWEKASMREGADPVRNLNHYVCLYETCYSEYFFDGHGGVTTILTDKWLSGRQEEDPLSWNNDYVLNEAKTYFYKYKKFWNEFLEEEYYDWDQKNDDPTRLPQCFHINPDIEDYQDGCNFRLDVDQHHINIKLSEYQHQYSYWPFAVDYDEYKKYNED